MTKKTDALTDAQKFVKDVLEKNFRQTVKGEALKTAARKLVDAIPAPAREKQAA